jgi:hypothetical protein
LVNCKQTRQYIFKWVAQFDRLYICFRKITLCKNVTLYHAQYIHNCINKSTQVNLNQFHTARKCLAVHSLCFCLFYHCIVYLSSIYGVWLSLSYPQAFLYQVKRWESQITKTKVLKRHSQNMLRLLLSEKTKVLNRHSQNILRLLISEKTKGLKRHSQNMLRLHISDKMKGLKRHSQNMLRLLISEKTKGLKRHSQNMLRLHISEKTSLYSLSKMSSFLSALNCCRFFFFLIVCSTWIEYHASFIRRNHIKIKFIRIPLLILKM